MFNTDELVLQIYLATHHLFFSFEKNKNKNLLLTYRLYVVINVLTLLMDIHMFQDLENNEISQERGKNKQKNIVKFMENERIYDQIKMEL